LQPSSKLLLIYGFPSHGALWNKTCLVSTSTFWASIILCHRTHGRCSCTRFILLYVTG
jgi:hypothetical protein